MLTFTREDDILRAIEDLKQPSLGDATLVIIQVGDAPNATLLRDAVDDPDHYAGSSLSYNSVHCTRYMPV